MRQDSSRYRIIIGLEVHVEPKTRSKMFCACSADYFGKEPNTHVCSICLGLPGSLPVPNKAAIEACVRLGLALGCEINGESKFDRKHYFYPDLPKGYQISQYDLPFARQGTLTLQKGKPAVRIRRVHMEEDTAKLIHEQGKTLIDFNRSGVPLIEIVSDPDVQSPGEAVVFLKKLQQIIRYVGVSDADMEKGTMRCEVNISFATKGREMPRYKVEIKNLNSFRSVDRALRYELERQEKLLNLGEQVLQETRGWDEAKGKTRPQRTKEEAQDYRYFPEPDIPPIALSQMRVESLRNALPQLPDAALEEMTTTYGLSAYSADVITQSRKLKEFYQEAVHAYEAVNKTIKRKDAAEKVATWVTGELIRQLKLHQKTIDEPPFEPAGLSQLLWLIDEGAITVTTAKQVLAEMVSTGEQPHRIVETRGLRAVSNRIEIEKAVNETLAANARAVSDYQAGKVAALGFLIGQVQKGLQGRADPDTVRQIILEKL